MANLLNNQNSIVLFKGYFRTRTTWNTALKYILYKIRYVFSINVRVSYIRKIEGYPNHRTLRGKLKKKATVPELVHGFESFRDVVEDVVGVVHDLEVGLRIVADVALESSVVESIQVLL